MRKSSSHLRVVVSNSAPSTQLTDTSGNPSESCHQGHLAAVQREWRQPFCRSDLDASALSLAEIRNIERRVRKALYP